MIRFIQLVGIFLLSSFSIYGQNKAPIQPIPPGVSSINFRVGCSLFTDPVNYTTGSTFSYNAPVNNSSNLTGGSGVRYGCLYSVPNQAWFIITVNTGGNLHFNFTNSNNRDVDAAVWGPISGNDEANACASTQNYPLTCDYDAYKPDLYINGAVAGQKYVMLVTNYSNVNTVINISQPTGGSVTYSMVNLPNCALVPTAEIDGTSTTIVEGQSTTLDLAFTGDSPWNYTLSDGTMGTSITSPLSLDVYPTASQTYTVNSVSNLCGTTGGSGSVGVSVTRDVELKSCFPLNGYALDSKSLNIGTLHNGVSSVANRLSEANGALSFDGIDDYVSLSASQFNNNTFAFAAWVKLDELPNVTNSERIAFSVGGTGDEHYISAAISNGVPYWKFSSNGNYVNSSSIVDLNWHLLTAVRTGGSIKIFVDGALTGTQEVTGVASYGSPLVARIGSSISNNKHFKGKIDELKVFDGSLIEPEILLLQNYTSCNNVYNDTYISTQSVSTAVICTGSAFVLEAFSNNITIDNGLQFLAELSDASGSFNNPTVVGVNTFLPISVTVPNNIVGGDYKLRIRYGGLVSVNSIDIYVNNPASYNITGTVAISDGQSSNLNLEFTGTGPWNYIMSNGLSGVATTSPWQITVDPDQSTTYSVSSAQNVCGNASINGSSSATVTVNYTKEFITCLPFSGNAIDSKSNNTTVLNGPILTTQRYGYQNQAYTFNGSNNYIEYTTNDLRKREFTMSAWVLVNALSGSNQYIISQGEVGTKTFQGLGVNNSGWFFQSYGNYGGYTASSNSGLATNQWVQLTAVRTYQSLKLYVNGELVRTTSSNAVIPFKSSDIGRIGANSSTLGNYFNGKIDDVRLFKGALNDEEVYALYTNNSDCPVVENTSLIVVRDVNPSTVCAGNTVSLYYSLSNVSASNMLRAELSDRYGSFTSPTVLGTGFTSSPISVAIPANTAESGEYDNYRIRLVSSGPIPVTSINAKSIIVYGILPTATVSGGGNIQYQGSSTVNIDFTGNAPWTYALNNGVSQNTTQSPISVSVSPYGTTTYTVTSVSNTCGPGTRSGSAVVNVEDHIGLNESTVNICKGQSFAVAFVTNIAYPTNDFNVEISNKEGIFAGASTIIGSGLNSVINCSIPDDIDLGLYKLRIVYNSSISDTAFANYSTVPSASMDGTYEVEDGTDLIVPIYFQGEGPYSFNLSNGYNGISYNDTLNYFYSKPKNDIFLTVNGLSNRCGSGSSIGGTNIIVKYVNRLVSCFNLDNNAVDQVGNNNGSLNGGVLSTSDRFGNLNSAMQFDGNNDYIDFSTTDMENQKYSYSVWVMPFSLPYANSSIEAEWRSALSVGSNYRQHAIYSYYYYYQGYPVWRANSTRTYYKSPEGVAQVTNQWYHLVMVSGEEDLKLYINGVLIGSTNNSWNDPENIYSSPIGVIGAQNANGIKRFFHGKIDDVQIYKGELNARQILALYENSGSCFDATSYTCLSDNTLNTILNGQKVYQVSNQLIGSSSIQSGSDIHFDSKNSVLLQPGFKTESNAVFSATVGGGCE
ncbi:LamG domain-containing protein [Arcticibacterium luteifluviistationis]|uniref:LamG-like jellyroll fold domain-containing protein n=1 Tax=Arcticibacterium luteifluviistationis TaxID=1784714 RepID=A0A2Z4GHR5_9BACT|nr:LamG domain-containing protein [Arcticibacterium luteifluviistationis]AWW00545.1 hypothetical protein DJ013_21100 [Arcticibacterium luteifluviistationis]